MKNLPDEIKRMIFENSDENIARIHFMKRQTSDELQKRRKHESWIRRKQQKRLKRAGLIPKWKQ